MQPHPPHRPFPRAACRAQVEAQAHRTFGAILERARQADRIRSVSGLLERFEPLFAAPQRVHDLAARGELEQVGAAIGAVGADVVTACLWGPCGGLRVGRELERVGAAAVAVWHTCVRAQDRHLRDCGLTPRGGNHGLVHARVRL
jgi:hypothetical protein